MTVYQTYLHNLPSQPTSFIGRASEIADIVAQLRDSECRLLTLVGPGGIGKTRLSLQVADQLTDDFEHGIFYVPLAPLTDDEDITATVINILGIQTGDTRVPREQLLSYLTQRHLLLIIDNFEHLLDGVDLLTDILQSAPQVKILATSREVLNLQEEWVWRVRGLPYPMQSIDDPIETYSAVQLFVDRARKVRHDFSLQHEQADVIRICQLVDGLPLALELAASWLKVLTCREIGAEIEHSITFLTSNVRNIPQRHRSIQAVFDHSWNLCTSDEQAVFRKLCIFRGGFERDSVERVAGASLLTLSGLVEKSMLKRLPSGRYEIQELLRQYAQEKLNATDEQTHIQAAHKRYYADFMQARTPDIKGRRQLEGLNEIKADFENIRVAWHRAIVDADYLALDKMMEGLGLYCDMHARYHEAHNLLKKAVDELAPNDPTQINPVWNRLRVRWIQAWVLAESKVIPDDIRQQLDAGLAFATAQDDRDTVGVCLWLLGELERICRNLRATQPVYDRALSYHEQLDNDYYMGRILRGIVHSLIVGGISSEDYAQSKNQKHIHITRSSGDRSGLAHALLYDAGFVDYKSETQILEEIIAIWREMGDWKSVGIVSMILAELICLNGQFDKSKHIALEAEPLQRVGGWQHRKGESMVLFGLIAVFRGEIQADRQPWLDVDILHLTEGWHSNHNHSGWYNTDNYILLKVLGSVIQALFNKGRSQQHITSALTLVREPFVPIAAAGCLPPIAMILAEKDEKEKAVQLLGLAFTFADHFLMGWMTHWQRLTHLREQLQAELGDTVYKTAWEYGAGLDLEDTIDKLLLYFGGEPVDTINIANQALIEPLTERELEVLALLVEGYSNRKIAAELTVVVGTVKTHTYNIRQKLGADTNIEATHIARKLKIV